MNAQLDLVMPPAVRRFDPVSSRIAADTVTANGSRKAHMTRIVEAVRVQPGCTSAELARITGLERHEAARRTADAEHLGLIVKGVQGRCSVSGKLAVTWWSVRREQAV